MNEIELLIATQAVAAIKARLDVLEERVAILNAIIKNAPESLVEIGKGDPNECPYCGPAPACLPEHEPDCPYLAAARQEEE